MAKYRIIKIERSIVWENNLVYVVQKRFLGFLWWYNIFNSDWTMGEFKSLDDAKSMLAQYIDKKKKDIRTVVFEQ